MLGKRGAGCPACLHSGWTFGIFESGAFAMKRLEGKTAIVTGASRGIGRAIAIELAREGARVAVIYQNNEAKAQEVADEIAKLGGAAILKKANLADCKAAH